ncbi:MAG: radical SAM protein [Candidatus Saccharimonadales bacterium]
MSKTTLLKSIKRYLEAGGVEIYDALAVETTTICDHNACPYCYMDCREGIRQNMTMATARAVAATLKELKISPREIWLPGGEPMMGPRLHEIIEVLAPFSDYFALITNGRVLSDPNRVRDLLQNPKIKEVAVSLHSADRVTHNWLVGHGADSSAYDWAIRAIVLLAQEDSELTVSVNLNINEGADLEPLIDEVESRGGRIDKVMFQVVNFDVARAARIPAKDKMQAFCRPTEEMVNEYFLQADALIASGRIREAMLIDALPDDVLKGVSRDYEKRFYQPAATPAVGVNGSYRADVVRRFE